MLTLIEIFGMLLLLTVIYLLLIYIYNHKLTAADKRMAIDYLPLPVYFGLNNKFPLVVNDKMYELIYSLKESPLTDMTEDFKCLSERKLTPAEDEKELLNEFDGSFFITYKDKVYCIEEKLFADKDEKIVQISGQEISDEYESLCNLRALNEELKEQNKRLQQYIKDSIEINHQKELLDAKINIHGKFGDCLAMTRHLLANPTDYELKKKVCGLWQEIIVGFSSADDEKKQNSKEYEELLRISKLIGCKLIIEGELPNGESKHLLVKFLREALNNAIRHANATSLTVDLNKYESEGLIEIWDDGSPTKPFTKMGGGLSSLHDALEKNGIILTIDTHEKFKILLLFPESLRK